MNPIKDNFPERSQKGIGDRFNSYFASDHHAFIVKKAERLASALHVITGFIAADEPVRGRLRQTSLDLVQHTVRLENVTKEGPKGYGARCAEIAALLETAGASGMVSHMNARIICDEYANLAQFVKERYGAISLSADASEMHQHYQQGSKRQKDMPKAAPAPRVAGNGQAGSQRQKDILVLVDAKGRITIKDAASAMPGVSEKTAQRELLAMVAEGVLIKEGERRWSTYRRPS